MTDVEERPMSSLIERTGRFVSHFRRDDRGVILVYAALLLTVLVGLSALAIDAGRQMSQQTQMQAIADALVLAGARELNQQSGAQGRATNAINALVSNGLTGLGYSGSITHSVAFYSALPAAASGFTGTTAVDSATTKYVAVTVAPVTIPSTFMPVTLRAGAQAIAGFTSQAFCDIPPVFICNPYETPGNSDDAAATAALRTALADPATQRQMLRLDTTQTSPGHFGFLVPPDGCNGASCLESWIAKTHPNTCFQTSSVDMNTGLKNSVLNGFNVRFDIYQGSINYSTDFAPSVNVRKGYLPGSGNNRWCPPKGSPASPVYYTLPIINTTGNTQSGPASTRATIVSVPNAAVTLVFSGGGQTIVDGSGKIPAGTLVSSASTTLNTITMSNPTSNPAQSNDSLTINWQTAGLPLDSNMTSTTIFGNGDWNCLDYWKINHNISTNPAPSGCTTSNPTISRYQVYRYEIANNLVNDWSGNRSRNIANGDPGNGESGAPYCAGAGTGVDTSTGGPDRRVIAAAIINCSAQSSLIGGGQNANNIPVAGFGKFFLTQPVGVTDPKVDPNSLYGEMSGLIGIADEVKILNQVQLYR
jgi:Flp pilus assembly protein TadG